MNIYQVVSEELPTYSSTVMLEPPEPYVIVEMVVARSRSQAGYLAWVTSPDWPEPMCDKPRMSIRIRKKYVDGPARLVTDQPEYQDLWRE